MDECAQRINQLNSATGEVFGGSALSAYAGRSLSDEQRVFFTLTRQRRGRFDWFATGELSGDLTRDAESDDIMARGMVRINRRTAFLAWALGVAAVALVAVGALQTQFWILAVAAAGVSLYQAALGLMGWFELRGLIADIMNTPLASQMKAKHEAEVEAGDALVDMTFDDAPVDAEDEDSARRARLS